MNTTKARAALGSAQRKELLLAHLLAVIGPDDDIELDKLINIHGALVKLTYAAALEQIQTLVEEGHIAVSEGKLPLTALDHADEDNEPYLQVGKSFDRSLEPQLEPVARWLISKAQASQTQSESRKPGARYSAAQIMDRRRFICDYLNSRTTSFSVAELAEALRSEPEFSIYLPKPSPVRRKRTTEATASVTGDTKQARPRKTPEQIEADSLKRLLLRDLQELLASGEIKRDGTRYEASKVGRLTELIKPTALLMLKRLTEDVLPVQIKEPLKKVFADAQELLDRHSASVSQDARWLNAFRIVPARPELDEPLINPNVLNSVHNAILERRKIEIEATVYERDIGGHVVTRLPYKATGSISHFLLEMPNHMAIEFWEDGSDKPVRIPLEDVTQIRVTKKHAIWPMRHHEPEPMPALRILAAGDTPWHENSEAKFILRVNSLALEHFKARRIGKITQVVEDSAGWYLVSFRARASVPLISYLRNLNGVAILRPAAANFYSRYHLHMKSADYAASHDKSLQLRLEELREEGHSQDYLEALSESPEWRECPTFIEFLISGIFHSNPYGFDADEVPDHVEQCLYLEIAGKIYKHIRASHINTIADPNNPPQIEKESLPDHHPHSLPRQIKTRVDFAEILEYFVTAQTPGKSIKCDWQELADQLWDALNDPFIYTAHHPIY